VKRLRGFSNRSLRTRRKQPARYTASGHCRENDGTENAVNIPNVRTGRVFIGRYQRLWNRCLSMYGREIPRRPYKKRNSITSLAFYGSRALGTKHKRGRRARCSRLDAPGPREIYKRNRISRRPSLVSDKRARHSGERSLRITRVSRPTELLNNS